jgi:hypothetical protein
MTANTKMFALTRVWQEDVPEIKKQVEGIWRTHTSMSEEEIRSWLGQLVYVVLNPQREVVGISTARKVHIRQLRNYFYTFRCMLLPGQRVPGLLSKLVVSTRDLLESIHRTDGEPHSIGLITLVENEGLKKHRNEAVWPASKMVYIGNSKRGHHIRVYYFKDARIMP